MKDSNAIIMARIGEIEDDIVKVISLIESFRSNPEYMRLMELMDRINRFMLDFSRNAEDLWIYKGRMMICQELVKPSFLRLKEMSDM